jgi:hypothetical protein
MFCVSAISAVFINTLDGPTTVSSSITFPFRSLSINFLFLSIIKTFETRGGYFHFVTLNLLITLQFIFMQYISIGLFTFLINRKGIKKAKQCYPNIYVYLIHLFFYIHVRK